MPVLIDAFSDNFRLRVELLVAKMSNVPEIVYWMLQMLRTIPRGAAVEELLHCYSDQLGYVQSPIDIKWLPAMSMQELDVKTNEYRILAGNAVPNDNVLRMRRQFEGYLNNRPNTHGGHRGDTFRGDTSLPMPGAQPLVVVVVVVAALPRPVLTRIGPVAHARIDTEAPLGSESGQHEDPTPRGPRGPRDRPFQAGGHRQFQRYTDYVNRQEVLDMFISSGKMPENPNLGHNATEWYDEQLKTKPYQQQVAFWTEALNHTKGHSSTLRGDMLWTAFLKERVPLLEAIRNSTDPDWTPYTNFIKYVPDNYKGAWREAFKDFPAIFAFATMAVMAFVPPVAIPQREAPSSAPVAGPSTPARANGRWADEPSVATAPHGVPQAAMK